MKYLFATLLFLLLIPIIEAQPRVIEVTQGDVEPPKTFIESFVSTVFTTTIVFGLGDILILGLLAYFLWWFIKKLRDDKAIFPIIIANRKRLAQIHKKSSLDQRGKLPMSLFRHNYHYPIKCFHHVGKKIITKIVGYYRGHYYSHDGTLNVLFTVDTKWLIYPKKELLMINKSSSISYQELDRSAPTNKIKDLELELPYDFEDWGDESLNIYAFGIDKEPTQDFWFPVLQDEDGNIIDMAFPTFKKLRNIALESQLYTITDLSAQEIKKSIELDSTLKKRVKLSDSSQEIDAGGGSPPR